MDGDHDDDDNNDIMDGEPGALTHMRAFLAAELDPAWADAVLVGACFVSGLVDSAVFNKWGCFVSMQTGAS